MNTAYEYRMPFGKYRGWRLAELDDGYLTWLYSLDGLRSPLRDSIDQEFKRRNGAHSNWNYDTPRTADRADPPPERAKQIVESGFKTLAKVHHPDHGGSGDVMRSLLEARAWLLERVAALETRQ